MQIVPVIDLKQGRVVRGIGGRRDEYRPIVSSLIDGHLPAQVARALAETFPAETIYVADLDAIEHQQPDFAAWRKIAAEGFSLWVDAGIDSRERAKEIREALRRVSKKGSLVVGLESIPSRNSLADIRKAAGKNAIFSLDLRDGMPLISGTNDASLTPTEWVAEVYKAGFRRLLVLDLADVGTGRGTGTLELCYSIHQIWPGMELIAGGGVRHVRDLQNLAAVGCSAALVASSLHDGTITRDDWDTISRLP